MSDVRLTNASPVERVDARPPEAPRPPVRRNLFGAPDRAEVRRCVAESLAADARDFAERYNFDPVAEVPLRDERGSGGDFAWEEAADAPEFYRRPPHGRRPPEPDGGGRESSRKRTAPGPCSSDKQQKRSHADDGDDDRGAGSQALPVEREEEEAQ